MQDNALEKKIRHIVESASSKGPGLGIERLSEELASKAYSGIIDFTVRTDKPYRQAKKEYRKALLTRLLLLRLGNISEVARDLKVDRRTIHRLVSGLDIDVASMKKRLERPYDILLCDMNARLENVLERYKDRIRPDGLGCLYQKVPEISDSILKELPMESKSLKDAEEDFQRSYIRMSLEKHQGEIRKAARSMGLCRETLIRKMKDLDL